MEHTFGSHCIVNPVFTLRGPDNKIILNNQPMTLEQTEPIIPSYWKIFSYTISNPTKSGEYKINLSVVDSYGFSIGKTIKYHLNPGPPNKITLSLDPSYIIADGNSNTNITIQVFDRYGNIISGLGSQIISKLDTGSGVLGKIIEKPDGSYKIQFTSSKTAHPDPIVNVSQHGISFVELTSSLGLKRSS